MSDQDDGLRADIADLREEMRNRFDNTEKRFDIIEKRLDDASQERAGLKKVVEDVTAQVIAYFVKREHDESFTKDRLTATRSSVRKNREDIEKLQERAG